MLVYEYEVLTVNSLKAPQFLHAMLTIKADSLG